jgi:hypothetical protein
MTMAMMERQGGGMTRDGGSNLGRMVAFVRGVYAKGKVDRFDLLQMHVTSSSRVWSWRGEELEGREPEPIAEDLMMVAEDDAKRLHGVQRYAVLAFMAADPQRMERRIAFRIEGEQGYDEGPLGESEPPTERGHVAQLMRHTEVLMRMAVGSSYENMRMMKDELSELREEYRKSIPIQIRMMQVLSELYDNKDERDQIKSRRQSDENRKAEMAKLAMSAITMLMPIVIKKLMGVSDKEIGGMLGEEQLTRVLGSLEPQQVMEISKHLSQEQQVAFFEVYKMYKAKEQAKEDEKKKDAAPPKKEGT